MKKTDVKKSLLIYSAVLAIIFWVLPLLFYGIFSLFIINPLTVLICSVLFSRKHGFSFLTVLITVVLFGPTIFVFYNDSAWIYIVFYAVFSLLGNLIGLMMHKKN